MRLLVRRFLVPALSGVFAIVGLAGQAVPAAAAPFQTAVFCTPATATATTNGSSFQYNGVNANATTWNAGTPCAGTSGAFGTVSVAKGGSGLCINEMSSHSTAAQFCGTDVPYTDTQWAAMTQGSTTNASTVQTIPLAAGAVGVSYSGCMANDPKPVKLTGLQISQIFSSPTGTVDAATFDPAFCGPAGTHMLHTVVRGANSGTTAIFKSYLFLKATTFSPTSNPWATPPDASPTWPAATDTTTCTTRTNNSDLAACLKANPTVDLITYLDESDIASNGIAKAKVPNGSEQPGNDLASGTGTAADTFQTPSPGGCTPAAAAAATPASTSANWAHVIIANSAAGYGICGFTYTLAFTTPVHAGVSTVDQANVVKDFVSYEVSDAGQSTFSANNYDPLPANLQALAQAGAAALTNQ